MKKILLSFFAMLIFFATLKAQDNTNYKHAIGVRLSSSVPYIKSGISYKHFIKNNAVEAILSLGDGVGICGLYEIHKPIASTEGLQWLFGFGGYAAFNNSNSNAGAAGIIGLDYKFKDIPLNITVDWKPELNIISKVGFEASGVGFSARFTF